MRAFFALLIDPEAALAIERWRQLCWPNIDRMVPATNYHITLAFLGDIDEHNLEFLHREADSINLSSFELELNRLGFWSKPGVLWLGSSEIPGALEMLSRRLSGIAGRAGKKSNHTAYVPHLTLKRRLREAPVEPLLNPDFILRFSEFHLMESVSHRQGVHYESRLSWSLGKIK